MKRWLSIVALPMLTVLVIAAPGVPRAKAGDCVCSQTNCVLLLPPERNNYHCTGGRPRGLCRQEADPGCAPACSDGLCIPDMAECRPDWQFFWRCSRWPGGDEETPAPTPLQGTPPGTTTPRPPDGTPTPTPGGMPPGPGATPTPAGGSCPAPSCSQKPPQASLSFDPPYPVVVGQDPDRRGVDVTLHVTSFPVIRIYYTREKVGEREETRCVWTDPGNPDHTAIWSPGNPPTPNNTPPCDLNWPDWEWKTVKVDVFECVRHVQVLPDPVNLNSVFMQATLSPSSRRWIEELAQRYPGARVRRPDWYMRAVGSGHLNPDGSYEAHATAHFAFEDPGIYLVTASAHTRGTICTPPRTITARIPDLRVHFLDTTLIR